MLCKNCKKELPDNASFCKYCGEKVEHKKSKENNEKSEFEKKVESIIKKELENILNLLKRGYLLLLGIGLTIYSLFNFIISLFNNLYVRQYSGDGSGWEFNPSLEFTYEFGLSRSGLNIGIIMIGFILIVLGILKLKDENKNN